ncbi:MAG: glycoside hydrolase family 3 N-terminal domain-containing protein [Humidesulfovibrio sp.]|uniref:glycoside hydrolase family 3 protein n=1 Tax=Humidesulfovibrio sp. TaxID=2910988 RepID=UPI0027F0E880|nr:glycoside hydrolase family 3 N-terminal domain-containing protein [Humidesulfovibrio sp.]MDQ7834704.1 glycoside hydrolase family 3 N-terminal domain-containing protein [Humidesulfovibrio sp.]
MSFTARIPRRTPGRGRLLAVLALCLSLLDGCALMRPQEPTPELRRMAGQMLLVGFRGAEPGLGTPEALPILGQIARLNLGGVILFDRDVALKSPDRNVESPQQLARLTSALQAAAKAAGSPPLFIAVDQEGGRVQRLKAARGFAETPAAAELCPVGQAGADTTLALAAGETVGRTLMGVGINLDFAPVADVNVNTANPVIGGLGRSFSADPKAVADCAGAFAWGLQGQGVLTAAKHFPGHGSSRADSHLGFTDVTDTWTEAELVPFAELTRKGLADMVMTAHVFDARLDPDYPATLSGRVIDGVLRRGLGFEGVVVTDDLQMRAVAGRYGLKESVRLIVNAGADVLLIGNNLDFDANIADKTLDALMELVAEGKVSHERLRQSFARIQKLKKKLAAQASIPTARPQANKETPCTSCSSTT